MCYKTKFTRKKKNIWWRNTMPPKKVGYDGLFPITT